MSKGCEEYLNEVLECLKKVPVLKKIDVLQESKKQIVKKGKNDSYEEIIKKMGMPQEWVKSLLEKEQLNQSFFIPSLIFFYIYTFFTGIFVVPFLGILGPALILCACLCPILGFFKLMSFLLNIEVPFLSFYFITFELHPFLAFPFSLLFGIIFFFFGKKCLGLLKQYLNFIKMKYASCR